MDSYGNVAHAEGEANEVFTQTMADNNEGHAMKEGIVATIDENVLVDQASHITTHEWNSIKITI